jgi:hypothetical protein
VRSILYKIEQKVYQESCNKNNMNFKAEHNDAFDSHDAREAFAIRSTNIVNELETMIEKTKRIENIVRSQLGLPMTIEILFDMACNSYNAGQATNYSRDPLSPPPKKRMKCE